MKTKIQLQRAKQYQIRLTKNLEEALAAARRLRMTNLKPAQKETVEAIIKYLQAID